MRGLSPDSQLRLRGLSPQSHKAGAAGVLLGVRDLLTRPEAGEVLEAAGPGAVDRGARRLEGDALDRRRAEDLAPARVPRRGLGRLAVVDHAPDLLEDLLAQE